MGLTRRRDFNIGWVEVDELNASDVRVGDWLVPTPMKMTLPGGDGWPRVEMTIDSSTGVARCADIAITETDPSLGVRDRDVDEVTIAKWIDAVFPLMARRIVDVAEDGTITVVAEDSQHAASEARRAMNRARKGRPRSLSPQRIQAAADTYNANPGAPIQAVMEAFGVSARTAFRYRAAGVEAGLIEED